MRLSRIRVDGSAVELQLDLAVTTAHNASLRALAIDFTGLKFIFACFHFVESSPH